MLATNASQDVNRFPCPHCFIHAYHLSPVQASVLIPFFIPVYPLLLATPPAGLEAHVALAHYLATRKLSVDVWDGESLLQVGVGEEGAQQAGGISKIRERAERRHGHVVWKQACHVRGEREVLKARRRMPATSLHAVDLVLRTPSLHLAHVHSLYFVQVGSASLDMALLLRQGRPFAELLVEVPLLLADSGVMVPPAGLQVGAGGVGEIGKMPAIQSLGGH